MSSAQLNRITVEAHLTRILASTAFRGARRQRQFLEFVVRQALDGNSSALKESVIGTEVFGRKPGFDSTRDAVVRVTASRVRKTLREYYEGEGRGDTCIVDLPTDGYIPVIMARSDPPENGTGPALSGPVPRPWVRTVAALTLMLAALVLLSPGIRKPSSVAPPERLTSDGLPKSASLWTDGEKLYFQELIDGSHVLASVPVTGGDVTRIATPGLFRPRILDARLPGPECLLLAWTAEDRAYLWDWIPGHTAEPLLRVDGSRGATWISNKVFADSTPDGVLRIIDRGSVRRVITTFPGLAASPRWSPSRRMLRFSVCDAGSAHCSIWQIRGLDSQPEPAPGLPERATMGTWGLDSVLFTFLRTGLHGYEIWTAREIREPRPGLSNPIKLVNMFFEYPVAVPAPDGAKVFAVGKEDVGRLVRYDVVRKRFVDFPGAIPAMQVDYSRDGLWLAYVNYSDNTLWKVRSDGIERTRLTQPDIEVGDPRWSPDGSQLAFMGRRGAGPYRVYLIGASGGKAVEVLQDGPDQGVPSWSPDGSALIFGDFRHSPPPAMCIHILDLKTRKVSIMPDSDGLWSPRLSPDGRFIAALSPDSQELKLRNSRSGDWQRVAAFSNIDYLYWTADSRYLHFRGAEGRPDSRRPFQRALYRVDPATRRLEKMLDLDHFSGTSVEWFGITPDGTPLGLAGEAIENIYAIAVPH